MKSFGHVPQTSEIAQLAHTNRKLLKSLDPLDALVTLIERMPLEFMRENNKDIAVVYNHFFKNKRIKPPVTDADIMQLFLNRGAGAYPMLALEYVYVDTAGVAYASDGYALAILRECSLSPGFYSASKGLFVAETVTDVSYPNWPAVYGEIESSNRHPAILTQPEAVTPSADREGGFNLYKFGDFWFDSRYLDKIEKCASGQVDVYVTRRGYLVVTDSRFTFVLMHARVPG